MRGALRIALAQGVILPDTLKALAAVGLPVDGLTGHRRLLVRADGIEYVLARPQDVATYVAHGAAELGIVGRDVLLESDEDVIELVDLGYGVCRFVVAAPAGSLDRSLEAYQHLGSLEVATKYPRVAERHFQRRGIQVELIKLSGAVELAPQVGLSDWIVDLVSTGRTLRENGLEVVEEIATCSARLIANRVAYARERQRIAELADRLEAWAGARP
ncbi:MAG: ATP phosphoribosyltransferase [Chloroflexi bacterium RIFCSPLOWO2_12_FULL_71_12]|nr:MAG: ATP phosphoribosyltransferase [Chloroflexi bacterium RIFCSPLOWO2_12_FULL_71_12]